MVDWSVVRADFPVTERYRYFLTASGGPMARPVYERSVQYYSRILYEGDSTWDDNVERREAARRRIARLINAEPDEIEFIPGLGFGMNLLADLLGQRGDVLINRLEFPSSALPWLHRRQESVRWVEPDANGVVAPERYFEAMDASTALIVSSHVQFSNGFRQDLPALAELKGDHLLIVNATQAAGAFEIDVKSMGIDALCSNSYKWLMAGYGCGFLYLSRRLLSEIGARDVGWFGVKDRDSLRNDSYQLLESAARFGISSPPFPAIFALDGAVDYLLQLGISNIQERVLELNRYLTDRLDETGIGVLSPRSPESCRSAQTLVALTEPEATVEALAARGILCTIKPEGMRVATHFFVDRSDIDALVAALLELGEGGR